MNTRPIIALVGRPNVGKSTLFNKLVGQARAITAREAGTTRDRHFGVARWFGHSWTIIDTAGVLLEESEWRNAPDALAQSMDSQVRLAVEESTMIVLVVDIQDDIQSGDRHLIDLLRQHHKPVVIMANKADNPSLRIQAEAYQQLGHGPFYAVSAVHGTGLRDFIDYLIEQYPSPDETREEQFSKITFIGRPNVGKSTLLNALIGYERAVVHDLPGTTRDTVTAQIHMPSGKTLTLVDTAGVRRRGKINPGVEQFSLVRTLRAINESNIVAMVLSIEEPPTRGDAHVIMYALEAKKPIILLCNKTDLARENIFRLSAQKQQSLGLSYLKRFPFMQRLPFFFTSGATKEGLPELLKTLDNFSSQA